jgi:hypothetical protein
LVEGLGKPPVQDGIPDDDWQHGLLAGSAT